MHNKIKSTNNNNTHKKYTKNKLIYRLPITQEQTTQVKLHHPRNYRRIVDKTQKNTML